MVGYRTLRKIRLKQALKTSGTLAEAKIKAGYSPKSNKVYTKGMKRYISEILKEGKVSAVDIENLHIKLADLAIEKNDLTNASRNVEDLGRMKAVYTDKSEVKQETNLTLDQKNYIINRIKNLTPVNKELDESIK